MGKFLVYVFSLVFHKKFTHALKPPIAPQDISDKYATMLLSPLRPADDNQLRTVIRKNLDTLWAIPSENFVGVLILQAVGNSVSTFERYETILKEEMFEKYVSNSRI